MDRAMASHEIRLRTFGQHCLSFYTSSLTLSHSSSSLSSTSTTEEKKSEDVCRVVDVKKKKDDEKIVIETLDRIIAIQSLMVNSQQVQHQTKNSDNTELQKSIDTLRHEHALIVIDHSDILVQCGLLEIEQFIYSDGGYDHSIPSHTSNSSFCSKLQHYIEIRDSMRRRAHQTAMRHRQIYLLDILAQSSTSINDDHNTTRSRLTQVNNVHHTLSIIRRFVNKYRSNVGAHSFLAGLHLLVQLQLKPKLQTGINSAKSINKDPFYVVRWKFNGSVLTEACRSTKMPLHKPSSNEDHIDNNNDLEYVYDAVELLFSFLIRVNDETDIEAGRLEPLIPSMDADSTIDEILLPELFLSFEIDKYISNKNLERILACLPDPKYLDARATGHVQVVVDASTNVNTNDTHIVPRKNVDGYEDEQWLWFSRLEFCSVL